MRALIQRVTEASVTVDGEVVGEIDAGLLILVCAMQGDTETNADALAIKISKLRIFNDDVGKMNRSLIDTGGAALVVSPVHPWGRHITWQSARVFHCRQTE